MCHACLFTSGSVSYTHLDVYKRQQLLLAYRVTEHSGRQFHFVLCSEPQTAINEMAVHSKLLFEYFLSSNFLISYFFNMAVTFKDISHTLFLNLFTVLQLYSSPLRF